MLCLLLIRVHEKYGSWSLSFDGRLKRTKTEGKTTSNIAPQGEFPFILWDKSFPSESVCPNWCIDSTNVQVLTWASRSWSVMAGFSDKFKSSFKTWTWNKKNIRLFQTTKLGFSLPDMLSPNHVHILKSCLFFKVRFKFLHSTKSSQFILLKKLSFSIILIGRK